MCFIREYNIGLLTCYDYANVFDCFSFADNTFLTIVWTLWWLGTKLSEDCCKYGAENNQNINENVLAKAAAIYGDARKHVEKEQEDFNRLLSSQVIFY